METIKKEKERERESLNHEWDDKSAEREKANSS